MPQPPAVSSSLSAPEEVAGSLVGRDGGALPLTLALVFVCALAALALLLLRRRAGHAGGPLRLVARLPLDGRHAIYLIEAGGKRLVVGAGDGAIATLAELEPTAAVPARAAVVAAPADDRRAPVEVVVGREAP